MSKDRFTSIPIMGAGFSRRATNILCRAGVATVGDLVQYSREELRKLRNFGAGSLMDVENVLRAHGLELRPHYTKTTARERDRNTIVKLPQVSLDEILDRIANVVRYEVANALSMEGRSRQQELLSRRQAADMVGVVPQTIMVYTRKGLLPGHKIGRTIRYKRQEILDAFGHNRASITK